MLYNKMFYVGKSLFTIQVKSFEGDYFWKLAALRYLSFYVKFHGGLWLRYHLLLRKMINC